MARLPVISRVLLVAAALFTLMLATLGSAEQVSYRQLLDANEPQASPEPPTEVPPAASPLDYEEDEDSGATPPEDDMDDMTPMPDDMAPEEEEEAPAPEVPMPPVPAGAPASVGVLPGGLPAGAPTGTRDFPMAADSPIGAASPGGAAGGLAGTPEAAGTSVEPDGALPMAGAASIVAVACAAVLAAF